MEIQDGARVKGHFSVVGVDRETGEVRCAVSCGNVVLSSADRGLDLILDRLTGDNTYSLNLTHCDIGTGTAAASESDTGLAAGVARAAKASATVSGKAATFRFFFPDADLPNGSYREIASFVDGTATLGTGQPFNRALFGGTYTKVSNTDTTVELTVTLSN